MPNWDIALHKWAREAIGRPFIWGETDCGSLVRQAYTIMYGRDIFAHVKLYDTRTNALRRMKESGGVRAVLEAVGAAAVSPGFAQQGDVIVEAESDGLGAAGVVVGRDVIWATVEDGVTRSPLRGRSGLLLRVPHG